MTEAPTPAAPTAAAPTAAATRAPTPASPDAIAVETADGVATLWLNRPAKRNAVTYEMWLAIAEACQGLAEDRDVRLVVVQGAGEHFCAGADIGELGQSDAVDYHRANRAADAALATLPKPTVAVVRGACVGGGAEIAIACDLRIAASSARVGITPARLGLVYPAFAVERLVRLAGPATAKRLLFTAELLDAGQAQQAGLLDEVHPPESLGARVDELVVRLAHERSLLTQMASKEMVDAVATTGRVDTAIERRWAEALATSPDRAEGVAAFAERRAPRFAWTPDNGR